MTSHSSSPELAWQAAPSRELLRLSWPLIVSLLSVSVAGLLDTLFVGQLGAVPLAAVGLGSVAVFTVLSFGFAVFSAAKVKVGEALGRGDGVGVQRALGVFLRLSVPLGVVSSLVAVLLAWFVLPLLSDGETGQLARDYTLVRALSFPAILWVAALSSWLQAQGSPRAPMLAALIAVLVHVPLNAWFLFGLGLGVRGLACASVLSALVEALALFAFCRPLPKEEVRWSAVLSTLRLGLPTGIERVLDMAAFAAVPLLLASVGPTHLAAHQIALQLCTFSFLPLLALSDGGSVLVSQAVGAGHSRLIHGVARSALGLAGIYAASLAALFYFGRGPLVAIFSGDEAVRRAGEATLAMAALLQLVNALYNALKGILRGLSQFRFVARVTVGVAWIITPPLTYLTSVRLGHGAPGAWFVMCVEVTLGAILLAQRWLVLGSSLDHLTQKSDIQLVMR